MVNPVFPKYQEGVTPIWKSSSLSKVSDTWSLDKGSSTPNRVNVGSVTKAQLEEIANIKLPDLNTTKLSSAMRIVEGTARNMGITVID